MTTGGDWISVRRTKIVNYFTSVVVFNKKKPFKISAFVSNINECSSRVTFLIEITGQSDILINTENDYEKENKAIKGDEGLLLKCWVSTLPSYKGPQDN